MYIVLPTWAILAAEPGRGVTRRLVQAAVVVLALLEVIALPGRTGPAVLALMIVVNLALVAWAHWEGRVSRRHSYHDDPAASATTPVKPAAGSGSADSGEATHIERQDGV